MFRRIRQLRISLAAKCQILFGAAVVMIIAAALFVPWHRMDDLMNQLNDHAASAEADEAVHEHAAGVSTATTRPWTETMDYQPPHLAPVSPYPNPKLSHFENQAIKFFQENPDTPTYVHPYTSAIGESRYRYARRVTADKSCLECHSTPASSLPSTNPAPAILPPIGLPPNGLPPNGLPQAAEGGFLGIVSVDIASQIDAGQVRLNRLFMFLAGLLAGSLAIAVFYLITTRLILQPVRVLQETAEKVSKGDLNIRSDISTGDEFQQLSETFNTMLTNLKQNRDQLEMLNKNLDLKLGQLAESNVALYESNRLKSEFLANVSHELRTPLNSILGFADLLKDAVTTSGGPSGVSAAASGVGAAASGVGAAAGPDSKSARYIQNILTSSRSLLELINDLLDLAKIEAGRMEVRSEPLSLGDLFEGLVSVLKPLSEAKGLSVAASVASDVPIIQTDPTKLQQILYNLLSNAIKFSPNGGRVDLAASMEDESSIRITVTDQGPGIEPEKQAMIFEKFRQIDAGVTRQHGGTGLGLAIAKELSGLLGGTIGVRSIVGEGAAFWVVLPLKISPESKDVRAKMILT